jgi:hypothetical protein
MHALVAAVLLRVARPDTFDCDAEPEPPDRELSNQRDHRASLADSVTPKIRMWFSLNTGIPILNDPRTEVQALRRPLECPQNRRQPGYRQPRQGSPSWLP